MPAESAAASSPSVHTCCALLAHDNGGAGVLAHRQHPAACDVGVFQEIERDELVVGRGLRIVENGPQLGEMAGPQQVGGIDKGLGGEEP